MSKDVHSGAREGLASADTPIVSSGPHGSADSRDTANNVNVAGGSESLPPGLALQAVLNEMRELTQALKASGRRCNCHSPETAEKPLGAASTDADQRQNLLCPRNDASEGEDDRSKFEREVSMLRAADEDITHMHKAKDEFLSWLLDADVSWQISWLDPDFRAEFQPEPSEQILGWFDTVWDISNRKSVHNGRRMRRSQWVPTIAVGLLQDEVGSFSCTACSRANQFEKC